LDRKVPLVVDLDGTLIRGDMLWEAMIDVTKSRPLSLPRLMAELFIDGKAAFKRSVSAAFEFDPVALPMRVEVLELIRQAKSEGRTIVLSTGSDINVAKKIAGSLDIFDEVIGSSPGRNNSGTEKARDLVERFGEGGYDYVGDSIRDLPVWKNSKTQYAVGPALINKRLRSVILLGATTKKRGLEMLVDIIRSLRPHQYSKNMLIFVPAFAAQEIFRNAVFANLLLAFAAFSLVASSVYIFNDIFDLQNDRQHSSKKLRPIASGRITLPLAIYLGFTLLFLGFSVGFSLGAEPMFGLAMYFVLSLLYSLKLKQLVIIDAAVLAIMYSSRLVFGAVVARTEVSAWLLGFSLFLFFSLALVKRYSEASSHREVLTHDQLPGRGYLHQDMGIISNLGVSAGIGSVIVFSLYLASESVVSLYKTPELLWLVVPLLLVWTSRIWIKASRKQVPEDPVLFALKDKFSLGSGVLVLLIFTLAQNLQL